MAKSWRASFAIGALSAALLVALTLSAYPQNTSDLDDLIKRFNELNQAGRYSEAFPIAQREAELAQKKFGSQHTKYSDALTRLAYSHGQLGHLADAETLFRRALAIRESTLGASHPSVAGSLNNLANICMA